MFEIENSSRHFADCPDYKALFPDRCRKQAEPSDETDQPEDNENE
jgi:hypothetical protein